MTKITNAKKWLEKNSNQEISKEVRKKIFTQSNVKLILNKVHDNANDYSIEMNVDDNLGVIFMDTLNQNPKELNDKFNIKFSDGKISFSGDKKDFKNQKDFTKKLRSTIDGNDLAWLSVAKKGPIMTFLQDKMFKSMLEDYKIDEMFDENIFPKITEKDKDTVYIDGGKGKKYELLPGTWIIELFKYSEDLDKKMNQSLKENQKNKPF
jgi:hypothetical protein